MGVFLSLFFKSENVSNFSLTKFILFHVDIQFSQHQAPFVEEIILCLLCIFDALAKEQLTEYVWVDFSALYSAVLV